MSVHTMVTITKQTQDLNLNALNVKKNYFIINNDDWVFVVLDGTDKEQMALSNLISNEVNNETIFLSANDFYWEAICYKNGNQLFCLKLDFENNKKSKFIGTEKLFEILNYYESGNVFEKVINDMKDNVQAISNVQAPFELAFNLPSFEGMDYDTIFAYEESFQSEYNTVHVEKQKKVKPKNVIIKMLGAQLLERGYNYDANYQETKSKVAFRKSMYDFWYTIVFEICKRETIEVQYLAPFKSVYLPTITYSNELDLRTKLFNTWKEDLEETLRDFELNKIQPFHPNDIYSEQVDPFMELHGYECTNMSSSLFGKIGEVKYKHKISGDIITFRHYSLILDLDITRNGLPHNAVSLVSMNKRLFNFEIKEMLGFRNEKEFRIRIELLMKILKICFDCSLE